MTPPVTGFERLAVFAVNRSEPDMHQFGFRADAKQVCGFKNLLKMERLAQVGHINNFLGFEVVNPHFNRGNVGRGIGKTAVGLFQNNRRLGLGSRPQGG